MSILILIIEKRYLNIISFIINMWNVRVEEVGIKFYLIGSDSYSAI